MASICILSEASQLIAVTIIKKDTHMILKERMQAGLHMYFTYSEQKLVKFSLELVKGFC